MARKIFAGKSPQKIRRFFGKKEGLSCCDVNCLTFADNGTLYAGTESGLFAFNGKVFEKIAAGSFNCLYTAKNGIVYAASAEKLYVLSISGATLIQKFDSPVSALAEDDNSLWLSCYDVLYKYDGIKFARYCRHEFPEVFAITAYGNARVYAATPSCLAGLWGKRPRWGVIMPETSQMPDCAVTALKADGYGHLLVGTEKGLYVYDSMSSWYAPDYFGNFPKEKVTSIDFFAGKTYIGTVAGLYVFDGASRSFLGANRWLPAQEVTCCAVNSDGTELWVGTHEGLSLIEYKMMTLEEKAAHFDEMAQKYYIREGYHTHVRLTEYGNIDSGSPAITDNDGLWTGSYIAAEACRYAVTGDSEALENARKSLKALLKLSYITGIDGFPARAYRRPGEDLFGNGDPEWHLTSDEKGELEWKGETSSDETSGHFFGLSYYYDLCADEAEKEEITKVACAITDHILEHAYTLCDADGLPTTWARWHPDLLNRDDMWRWERGINSYELLCMLKVCYHMSGDEKYMKEYRRLIDEEHYALNCARHKMEDAHSNHIDDHLGFLTAATLLRYEDDPKIRAYYLFGLKHHWEYERIERCPLFNIVYGAFTGDCCDLETAVESLEKLPLDFIEYPLCNEARADLVWDEGQEVYNGPRQLKEPLPYDEKPVNNFDASPFAVTRGQGLTSHETTIYLLPYWMGRYFGLLGD